MNPNSPEIALREALEFGFPAYNETKDRVLIGMLGAGVKMVYRSRDWTTSSSVRITRWDAAMAAYPVASGWVAC